MRIQEICEKTGLSKRNIHYYIKERLITPAANEANGYYDFSEEDCRRLLLVHEYRKADIPISVIRSLLKKPVTAGYYLNLHVKQLKQQLKQLEQTIEGMNYILDRLPIKPDFSTLYTLSMEAGLPDSSDKTSSNSFDTYNNTLVNRFLWSSFLSDSALSEYQQFLWAKLNKITNNAANPDYRMINDFLQNLDARHIDSIFAQRSQHYERIASLDKDGCGRYADEMMEAIDQLLKNHSNIYFWKQNYDNFFAPNVRIFASPISDIVAEMSTFFTSYRDNIHLSCHILHQWFPTERGSVLAARLQEAFGSKIDLECCYHGQLEALTTLPELCQTLSGSRS